MRAVFPLLQNSLLYFTAASTQCIITVYSRAYFRLQAHGVAVRPY